MAYWCCAQLEPNRERLASHLLMQERFTVYAPRVRVRRIVRGRREDREVPLFPRYLFIEIVQQWYRARWCPGVVRLIMDGITPAKVPDAVIEEIRSRERGGLIELPKPRGLRRGDQVRVERGVFQGRLGLYDGQTARERVWVLLQLLGSQRRTELAAGDVVPIEVSL